MVRCVDRVADATTATTMMQGIDASPAQSAPSVRRRTLHRGHAINLCCAQSVAPMVEEIARHLRGLGFQTRVSCGAAARTALLGGASALGPAIHVVCVQGNQQERVLKPLRQALATHGGPDQHLFVAVLDLSVPLTMVGQIRRFAEALERTPAAPIRVGDHLGDRRRWREHFGHRELAELPTRSYPVVTERGASGPRPAVRKATGKPTGPRTIASRSKPVRIGPTAKNRQVTAPMSIVERDAPRRPRRQGRARATSAARDSSARSGELTSSPEPSARAIATPPAPEDAPSGGRATRIGAVAHAIVAAHEAAKAQVAETKQRVEAAVLADAEAHSRTTTGAAPRPVPVPPRREPAVAEPIVEHVRAAPSPYPHVELEAPRRRWPAAVAVVGLAAAALLLWRPWARIEATGAPTSMRASATGSEPARPGAPEDPGLEPAALARAVDADDASKGTDAAVEAAPSHAGSDGVVGDAARTIDPGLAEAVAQYRVLDIQHLYVTRRRGNATSWADARARCQALTIDGVDGWRLPWRRELKLIGVATRLGNGTYWSHSVPDGQPDSAYVYDVRTRELSLFLKQEPTGEVICVKPRDR